MFTRSECPVSKVTGSSSAMASFGRRSASATSASSARALSAGLRLGTSGLLVLLERERQQRARGRPVFHDRGHHHAFVDRRVADQAVILGRGDARFRLVVQPDERLADRDCHQRLAGLGPPAERQHARLELGGQRCRLFHPPAIRRGKHAVGGHVHFITAATDGGHLLLGQRQIAHEDRDLIQTDAGAGGISQRDRGFHDPARLGILLALEVGLAKVGPAERLVGRHLRGKFQLANGFGALALLLVQQRRVHQRGVIVGIGRQPHAIRIERLLHVGLNDGEVAGLDIQPLRLADLLREARRRARSSSGLRRPGQGCCRRCRAAHRRARIPDRARWRAGRTARNRNHRVMRRVRMPWL